MGIVEEKRQKEETSDATKMLEAALEQMDGIILGESFYYLFALPL